MYEQQQKFYLRSLEDSKAWYHHELRAGEDPKPDSIAMAVEQVGEKDHITSQDARLRPT